MFRQQHSIAWTVCILHFDAFCTSSIVGESRTRRREEKEERSRRSRDEKEEEEGQREEEEEGKRAAGDHTGSAGSFVRSVSAGSWKSAHLFSLLSV